MEEQTCLRGGRKRWGGLGQSTPSPSSVSGDTLLSASGSPNNWLQRGRRARRGRGEGKESEERGGGERKKG